MSASLLANVISPQTILLDQEVTSKKRAFEQIGLVLENQLKVGRAQVFDSLFAREKLGSTALGHGVAVPHGRIKGLKGPVAVVMRPREPVPFDAPDGKPVQLLIALLFPQSATDIHLLLYSELAQMLSDAEMRGRLQTATCPETVYQLIRDWQPWLGATAAT